MRRFLFTTLLVGAFLAGLMLGGSAPAAAQLMAEPEVLGVSLRQGEATERTVTLTNTSSEAVAFCLSFGRPLEGEPPRLSDEALASACGEYGEVLYRVDGNSAGIDFHPYGLTMTPEGRLFGADFSSNRRTHELTQELEVVRSFFHPIVDELEPHPVTTGITFKDDKLWWMNAEGQGATTYRVLLLEGDLDGNATGRRIELPIAEEAPDPYDTGVPVGASYVALTERFYFADFANDDLWAVDTLGNVVEGYPVEQDAYPDAQFGGGPDAHLLFGETDIEGLRLEIALLRPGDLRTTRIVVLDRYGRWSGIETPIPDLGAVVSSGNPLRSRTDPNGLVYLPFSPETVAALRPHPLPPSWLALSAWDGTLEPGESAEVVLTFSAGTRDVGNTYSAALQVFDAETEEVVEVPLTMEVTEGTDTEDGTPSAGFELPAPYPNPSARGVAVPVVLRETAHVRLTVYDVLGREVAVLADGPMEAGERVFFFDRGALPAGVYLVRLEAAGRVQARRITLLK